MNLEQERQAFEAWFSTTESCKYLSMPGAHSPFYQTKNGVYINTRIDTLWQTWLARAKVSPWVSVNDSLPKGENAGAQWSETVLARTKKRSIVMAQRSLRDDSSPNWQIIWADTEDGDPFTHWMPIPTSPEHPI